MEQIIKIKKIITRNEEENEIDEIDEVDEINDGGDRETIWRKITRVSFYLLALLTPLFFLPLTIAPVEINKQIFAAILALVAFAGFLIDSFDKGKIAYPKSLLSFSVVVLLAVFGTSAFLSQSKTVSLYGNLIQPDSLFSFFIYGLVFFLAAVFLKNETDGGKKAMERMGRLFFIGLAIATVLGFFQIFGGKIDAIILIASLKQIGLIGFNTVGSILNWGVYLAFGLAMIIAVLFGSDKKKDKRLIGLGFLIFFGLIILNYSLVWLALAATTLLLAAYKFAANFKLNSGLLVIVSLFLLLGIAGQSLPAIVPVPFDSRPSLSATWSVAKESLSGLSLLFGSGPATFGYDYALYRPIELNQTNFWPIRFNQGFSFLATALGTVGVLGVLAILFLIFAFLKHTRREYLTNSSEEQVIGNTDRTDRTNGAAETNDLYAGPMTQAVSLGIIFLLINWLLAPLFFTQSIFIFLGLGLIAALSGSVKEIFLGNFSKRQSFFAFFVLIVLITASLASIFYLGKKYAAAVYYEKGFAAYNVGDIDKALTRVDKAARFDPRQDQYFQALSRLLLVRIDNLARQGLVNLPPETQAAIQNAAFLAIESGRQATVVNPADSLNWSNLGGVYEKIIPLAAGADVFAEENYKKAMELDPKNPQEPVNAARSFIIAADLIGSKEPSLWREKLNKAKTYLEKSIALKADYAPAHFLSASISLKEGKVKEAIEKLELTKMAAPFDPGLAFQLGLIYYQNNQPDKARLEFERAISIDPNYSNSRYFLGLIYDNFGNKQAALVQFEKIAELNPDNQEIKKIVKNLKSERSALDGIVPPDQPPTERLETPVTEMKKQ